MIETYARNFELGAIRATPGALGVADTQDLAALLRRHASLDQGDLCSEDHEQNRHSVETGGRIMSAFQVHGERVWLITEADRSATTILLPEEY